MPKHLTSPSNPLIKQAIQLKNKARERKTQGLFIAEGLREIRLALLNGFEATHLFYDPSQTNQETVDQVLQNAIMPPKEIITVDQSVLEKIAYRASVPNVVAICKNKTQGETLSLAFERNQPPLILVLEGIEKPGNLGAILRTADAAGVDAVFVCEPDFDLFNPNAIRASLGAIFTLDIFDISSETAVSFLKNQGITIYATYLEAAKPVYQCDFSAPSALVLGAEASGISKFWVEQADQKIIIPMSGQVDSMNVSASAAIVLFEAVRQRRKDI
ncbi:MAG: RNA methyltransferase [Saprospiraceae bacterium]